MAGLLVACAGRGGDDAVDQVKELRAVPNDTPDWVSPGSSAQSVSDPLSFQNVIDHRRYTLVNRTEEEYSEAQVGRLLLREDFEGTPLQWQANVGALALDATVWRTGKQSLNAQTGAVAGNTVIARKFEQLPADQSVSTFPLVVIDVWFKPLQDTWRDVQVFIRPDDSQQKWQAAIRYHNQQAGVRQSLVEYLDSTGTFVSVGTYALRPHSGQVWESWHHMMMCLNYKQGATGYLTYQVVKFDDLTFKPSGAAPSAQSQLTQGFRECSVDLLATTDSGVITQVNWDQFILCDLSNAFQL